MLFPGRLIFLGLLAVANAMAAPLATPEWNRVAMPAMKTSIYVGSVTLVTSAFKREGDTFTATYEAKVIPWFFWSETGHIVIRASDADLAKLLRGERMAFTGDAANHKGKPRRVSGYADPEAGGATGKIKVRIAVDDVELIFHGPYKLSVFDRQASSAQ
ncbi:MAG: hypothetical protein IT582_04065 [Opitutaceae bacterium]|nr:hypothetical protein [Opitutaceae bacterium]